MRLVVILALTFAGVAGWVQEAVAAAPGSQAAQACPQPTRHHPLTYPAKQKVDLPGELTVYCGTATQTVADEPAVEPVGDTCRTCGSDSPGLVDGVAKILSSLAWPIAAIFMVLILRREIARLLARLKRGKWGSAEFEFENELREIEHEVEIPATPEAVAVSQNAVELASQDPRGAILAAWLNVETAMSNLVRVQGLGKDYTRVDKRPLTAIRLLQDAQVLDSKYVALAHSLRTMRNEAAHNIDFKPDPDAVIRYTRLANELAAEMQRKAQVQTG